MLIYSVKLAVSVQNVMCVAGCKIQLELAQECSCGRRGLREYEEWERGWRQKQSSASGFSKVMLCCPLFVTSWMTFDRLPVGTHRCWLAGRSKTSHHRMFEITSSAILMLNSHLKSWPSFYLRRTSWCTSLLSEIWTSHILIPEEKRKMATDVHSS